MVAVVKLPESRTYNRQECITFRKTAERFGGLSNMAGGYILNINGVKILTSEALYQACRFPHMPEVQRLIIAERSPMTAKMKSKPYRDNSRSDWDIVRTKIMRWCLQVKLIQNWDKFSKLLLETGDLPIVEDSRKDDFWGAKPEDEEFLTGANVLGRLLMQVREQIASGKLTSETIVQPLPIQDFLLYGQDISPIVASGEYYPGSYMRSLDLIKSGSQPSSDVDLLSISKHELERDEEGRSNENLEKELVEIAEFKFDKYDSLQFVLLPIVEKLQESEHTDKELAKLFTTNLKQMRDWLKRAVELGKVRKLSKPVRYVAESQLPLI
ncbi:NADAR family protein [Myxacorys almedinensis]|uniref:DUF1768 domain-containing protein n=1 Tax=Myxacorys almedinensis A TaxID=2690445 RepID=A0A8J8CGQ6_9CYAN|nr:NADAR family protein [Myxacorys almedinensis]NDJ15844.1 DUF1768 domain-containing protein [Myxacorys almedinensis A]